MDVIHLTNYFRDTHRHVGGAEQACFRMAMLQRDHGWSVSVVSTKPDLNGNTVFPCYWLPIVEDYLPSGLKKYVEAAKWYSLQYDPFAYRAFRKVPALKDADVVHFHNCQFLTLSLLSQARNAGKKTIASIYDYWFFCPTVMLADREGRFCERAHGPWCTDCLPPMFRSFQKLLLSVRRRIVDRYLKLVDGFHVLSEHSRSVLIGYGIPASRIHVAPLTLPLEFKGLPVADEPLDPHMILFAGWLNERKGLHRLLEALPLVVAEHPSVHLVAIGGKVRFGEQYERKLEALMDSGHLRDRVRFTDHVPPSEMKKYLGTAAVVVIPEQYENMSPLLMIEAMSMAKPVVISRTGGIPEFVEHGVSGLLADPHDPRDFAEGILRILNNPGEAKTMGERARQSILVKCGDNVVWEKCLAMYESVMR